MTVLDPKYFLYENWLRWPLGTLATFAEWSYTLGTLDVITDPVTNKKVGRYSIAGTLSTYLTHNPANKIITDNRLSPWLIDIAFEQLPDTGHFYINVQDSSSNNMILLRVDPSGALEVLNNVTWTQIIANLFVVNEWHNFAIGFDSAGNNWVLSVDSKKFGPYVTAGGITANNFDKLQFGSPTAINVKAKIDNSYLRVYNAGLRILTNVEKGEATHQIDLVGGQSSPGYVYLPPGQGGYSTYTVLSWISGGNPYGPFRVIKDQRPGQNDLELQIEQDGSPEFKHIAIDKPFPYIPHERPISGFYADSTYYGKPRRLYIYYDYSGGLSRVAYYNSDTATWGLTAALPANQRILFLLSYGGPTGIANKFLGCIVADNTNPCTAIRFKYYNPDFGWGDVGTYAINQAIDTNIGLPHTNYIYYTAQACIFGIADGGGTRWFRINTIGAPFLNMIGYIPNVIPDPNLECFLSTQYNPTLKWFMVSLWDPVALKHVTYRIKYESTITGGQITYLFVDNNKYQFNNIPPQNGSEICVINNNRIGIFKPAQGLALKLQTPTVAVGEYFLPGAFSQVWRYKPSGTQGLPVSELVQITYQEETVAASLELRVEATGKPSEAILYSDPDAIQYYKEGFFYPFQDGFGINFFTGRMFNPRSNTEKSLSQIKMVGLDYEALQKYELDLARPFIINIISPAFQNFFLPSNQHLRYIIGGNNIFFPASPPDVPVAFEIVPANRVIPSFLYVGFAQGTVFYKRNWNLSIQDVIKFMRHLDYRVIYYEPDGQVNMRPLPSVPTGIRWTYGHPQITLISIDALDMRITRSEVIGAKNKETQVRYVHIGNSAIEGNEGISFIKIQDSNILNHNEAAQLAVNRFNIYTNPTKNYLTYFIKLRVKSQGFIQPGKTIDFEWNDGVRIVPRDDYYVMQVDPIDLKNDIAELYLVNNIITYKEFMDVYKDIGRDEDNTGTNYDASKSSSTQGTPVQQNSNSRIRSGTYEWRTPEPTLWDFDRTSTPAAAGGVVTLSLSNIIPDGVRAVHIRVQFKSSTSAAFFLFRKFGNTGAPPWIQGVGDSVDNTGKDHECHVVTGVSDDRRIELYSNIAQANWTTWNMSIVGWDI